MTSVELLQYWAIIRRWLHLIVAFGIIAALSALGFSLRTVPVYSATSVVLIQQATGSTLVVDYASVLTNERLASTYAQLLTTRPVLEETLKRLGMAGVVSPDSLKGSISVSPVQNTSLLRIRVEDTDPERAVKLANTIPVVFSDYIQRVQTQRFQESKRSLEEQIQRLQDEISTLQARIDEVRNTDGEESPNLTPLQTQLATLQSSYANLYRQYEEVRLAEARAQDTVVLTEPALKAIRVRPQTFRSTLMALVVGLMLGVGAAFLIEYLDDTLKTPDDIAGVADIPVLTGIAQVQETEEHPLIAHHQPKSPVSEAFRVLRTNIQFAGVDNPLRTIVVTSPSPREGKSFITANLGVVMAQMGHKVVIVDADLRKPFQHRLFNLPRNIGLTNVLVGNPEVSLEEALHETEVPNLWVLTCGSTPPNPSELLGSQRMSRLVEDLLTRADVILFDTPPTLAVTDASILAKNADGVLLIAKVGATRLPAFYQAYSELQRVGVRILGVVLNMLPPRGSRYYSYYYYRYNHYYYYSDGEKSESAQRSVLRRKKRKKETA